MSESNQLENWLTGLGLEILSARAGSQEGQFPILDLLGNLRETAARGPAGAEMSACCQQGWERMVGIVESGQCFTPLDIQWLNELLSRLQRLAKPGTTADATPAGDLAAPAPAITEACETNSATGKEAPLVLNLSADADLLREFVIESREHLDNIEEGVLALESNPGHGETLNTIFRAFHTFKGSAGFLNLVPINQLAHVLESLLDLARQRKLTIDSKVIEMILRGRDTLKEFLDEIDRQLNGSGAGQPIEIPTAELKSAVQELLEAVHSGAVKPDSGSANKDAGQEVEAAGVGPDNGGQPTGGQATTAPPLLSLAAESPAENSPVQASSVQQSAVAQPTEHTGVVKVETVKLDALLDLIGEMVIAQSLVSQNLNRLARQDAQFGRNFAQLARTTKELQRIGMAMRMVPVRGAFQKMARVVRDLAKKENKRVQLVTEGEETELDRGVVEVLNDPLLHMIRNSVDHGIESEEARTKAGKPAAGTIHLRANHQGGNIVIEIEDDGAGLDRDRILAKAIERGLTSAAAELSDAEIYSFIFAPGFSTAEKVTDVSGRGVGLDVVRRNIERLRGCVDTWSAPGQGSRFKITLPLTLAIIDGLVVKVGEERYIIPTLSVRESFRARPETITRVQNRAEVVNVRGRLIPMLRLYEHFGLKPSSTDATQGIIIVAQSGANFRCLLVDSLESKQEVVIKNLNDVMVKKNRSLAGAAILGDGRVGLILDVNALVQLEPQTMARAA
jgi:two-component system chemotaxis sensor kinase CheA